MLRQGAQNLTEAELLAIIVSSGTPERSATEIAQNMIERFQSLRGMADQPVERILEVKGIGKVKLCRIAAAFEIARRVIEARAGEEAQ